MKIHIANPTERPEGKYYRNTRFLFAFGAYGDTHVLVYARPDHIDDALEEAAGWLADHAPGLIMAHGCQELQDLYAEARNEWCEGHGAVEEEDEGEVWERATVDLTYTESGYIASYEWWVNEVSRTDLMSREPEFIV